VSCVFVCVCVCVCVCLCVCLLLPSSPPFSLFAYKASALAILMMLSAPLFFFIPADPGVIHHTLGSSYTWLFILVGVISSCSRTGIFLPLMSVGKIAFLPSILYVKVRHGCHTNNEFSSRAITSIQIQLLVFGRRIALPQSSYTWWPLKFKVYF